jgi:hypothetical protein
MNHIEFAEPTYGALKRCSMNCDHPIEGVRDPFPNNSGFMLGIISKAGGGKTSLLTSMFMKQKRQSDNVYYKKFQKIYYVCGGNLSSIIGSPFSRIPDANVYKSITYEMLDEIKATKEQWDADGSNNKQCLIIDDCAAEFARPDVIDIMKAIAFNRRHSGLSVIILYQYSLALDAATRAQLSHMFIFKPVARDIDNLRREALGNMSVKSFNQLARTVFREKGDFLTGDTNTGVMHRNTQRISGV